MGSHFRKINFIERGGGVKQNTLLVSEWSLSLMILIESYSKQRLIFHRSFLNKLLMHGWRTIFGSRTNNKMYYFVQGTYLSMTRALEVKVLIKGILCPLALTHSLQDTPSICWPSGSNRTLWNIIFLLYIGIHIWQARYSQDISLFLLLIVGHGFKLAPVTGKLLSQLALDLEPDYDISPFRISRFEGANQLKSVL